MNYIIAIEKVLNLQKMRNLDIAGKIIIFKTLDLSEITHLALVTAIPKATNLKQRRIPVKLIWSCGTPKIEENTKYYI